MAAVTARMLILLALVLTAWSHALGSTLTQQEISLLDETSFSDTVKRGNCVIIYYNSAAMGDDRRDVYGLNILAEGDRWMRTMRGMLQKAMSSVNLYKVDWKAFSAQTLDVIRRDVASSSDFSESPSLVAYERNGVVAFLIRGPLRSDAMPWLINHMLLEYIPTVKTDKGRFMLSGWLTTDTDAPSINIVRVRKERRDVCGKRVLVRINSYQAGPYDGHISVYERIYLENGRLVGSIETYGGYGTASYFDCSGRGLMQYMSISTQAP